MPQFDNVSVVKKANVYFDGKCVSHTIQFADGEIGATAGGEGAAPEKPAPKARKPKSVAPPQGKLF